MELIKYADTETPAERAGSAFERKLDAQFALEGPLVISDHAQRLRAEGIQERTADKDRHERAGPEKEQPGPSGRGRPVRRCNEQCRGTRPAGGQTGPLSRKVQVETERPAVQERVVVVVDGQFLCSVLVLFLLSVVHYFCNICVSVAVVSVVPGKRRALLTVLKKCVKEMKEFVSTHINLCRKQKIDLLVFWGNNPAVAVTIVIVSATLLTVVAGTIYKVRKQRRRPSTTPGHDNPVFLHWTK